MSPRADIESVTDFVLDGTHGSPVRVEFGIPVLSAQNIKDGVLIYETERYTSEKEYYDFSKRVRLQRGDVLFTIVGTIGRAAVVVENRPVVFQRSVAIIRPDADRLSARYFYHATQTQDFVKQINSLTNKSAQAGVYLGKLKGVEISLPSLGEQRRIAAILDQADDLRRKRRVALERLDQLSSMIFVAEFDEGRWPECQLSEVVRSGTIVTYGIVQAGGEYEGGVPYIRTGDIVNGEIAVDELRRTDPKIAAKFNRSRVQAGDIVMSIRATVGTTATVPVELDGANLTQGTARISPGPRTNSAFLLAYLRSTLAQTWIAKQVKGATFREITLARLRELPIPVPPFDLQHAFAARIAEIDRLKASHRAHLVKLDALFATLQHRAFRGEL